MRTCKHSADAKLRWRLCTLKRWGRVRMTKKGWDGEGWEAKKRSLHIQASAERPYWDLPALFLFKCIHQVKHLSLQTAPFLVLMHLMPFNIKQIKPFSKALSIDRLHTSSTSCIPHTLCSSVTLTLQSFHSLDPKSPLLQQKFSCFFEETLS